MKALRSLLGITAVVLALLMLPGHAAPVRYAGDLSLRSPVWANQDRLVSAPGSEGYVTALKSVGFEPNLRYLDLAGQIRFTQDGSPLALWVNGEHSFSRGYFVHENKLRVGLDLKVQDTPLTLFSYWERRFDGDDLDRVFVGARLGFRGQID